jgi:hypothetical protein
LKEDIMKSNWLWFVANIAIFAFMFAGLRVLDDGPTPPDNGFNVERAFSMLETLNPEGRPHPAGSEENRRIRKRIEQALEKNDYEPVLQKEDFCTSMHAGCTALENVFAVKKGTGAGDDAILITAHYDSAPVAPGAGDDLAAVAAMLETARLVANESFENDVIFLLADGEETGLRGAMAFAEHSPEMARVKLVLNFEGRGVAGPSAMFETSRNNRQLINIYAKASSRPVANSLMYDIYRKMPNNTDLTIYKQAGAAGLNFAFSRGVALYHSSRDSAENLSLNSLAHHGDNMLSVLRQTGSLDLSSLEAKGDSTFVDLFGLTLLHWPAALNLPAALAAILLLFGIGARTNAFGAGPLAFGFTGALSLIAGLVFIGWALSFPLGVWPGIHPLDHPHPWPGRIALLAGAVLVAFISGTTLSVRAGIAASLFANWLLMALFALALSILLPGGAYLALAPALVFAIAGFAETFLRRGKPPILAAMLGLLVAAYMAVYHFLFFDVVFNFQVSYLKTPMLALTALASAPLLATRRSEPRDAAPKSATLITGAFIAIVMAIAATVAMFSQAYTENRPRSTNLAYMQGTDSDGATQARWRLFTFGPSDEDFIAAAGFPEAPAAFKRFGGRDSKARFLPAHNHDLAAPSLTIASDDVSNGVRIVKGRLAAGRAGPFFGVTFSPETKAKQFLVNGKVLIDEEKFLSGKLNQSFFNGFGARSLSFELHLVPGEPADLTLFEVSALPDDETGQAIIDKRPNNAAPLQFGDHAEVQRNYRL